MKRKVIITATLLLCGLLSLQAQQTTGFPPICLDVPLGRGASALPAPTVTIEHLKAVLIVGPAESSTSGFIQEMKGYATLLKECGVDCIEFYSPENSWEAIKKATNGANFLLYAGHGIYDGSSTPKWVGSFCLDSGFVKSDIVISDLQLAKNAIVLFNHACFSAGASGSDRGDIGSDEAKRRVSLYSKPFLKDEFAAYYASSWNNGLTPIIASLFAGMTLGEAYKSFCMYNASTTLESKYPDNQIYDQWISRGYDFSFVGDTDKKLSDLFGQ